MGASAAIWPTMFCKPGGRPMPILERKHAKNFIFLEAHKPSHTIRLKLMDVAPKNYAS
jgi:hypothetical protein